MATNYVQPGETVTLTCPAGGISSGQGLVVGNVFGIAAYDALESAGVEVQLVGVWTLPKAAGVINEGAGVWWDDSAKAVKNASSAGLFPIGVAVAAAGDTDTTCTVRLNGVSVVAASS
jgi:predicted RecA/RadA family phage recombinase